jgi:hypothetical protein
MLMHVKQIHEDKQRNIGSNKHFLPLFLVIQLHLCKLPGSLQSNSSSPPSTSWSLTLSSSLLLSRDTSTSPQGLNVPPYSSGTFGSQLELELLSEESLEFCERERDDNVRLELLLWMPRGYILCMYLLPAAWLMAACSFLSMFFMWLGLFSYAWCCLLCDVVSIVLGGWLFWRQTIRGCLPLPWFEINVCEVCYVRLWVYYKG